MFVADSVELKLSKPWFVPSAAINCAATPSRRMKRCAWPHGTAPNARPRPNRRQFPDTQLSYLANVYNEKARAFYHKHGVQLIAAAYEAHEEAGEVPLMITKHCLRFSFNLCPKQAKGVQGVQVRAEPMTLVSGDETYTLRFDCKPCEMHVVGAMKPGILKSPPPSNIPYSPSPSTARARALEALSCCARSGIACIHVNVCCARLPNWLEPFVRCENFLLQNAPRRGDVP
jgi:putative protease